jgi:5-methylcytosine-specific restriction enzyme subunit McrC
VSESCVPPSPIRLSEWTTEEVDVSLTDRDRAFCERLAAEGGNRLVVEELRTRVRVRTKSWVGVVRFENFEIQVTPKAAGGNRGLVEMIEVTTGLRALRPTGSHRTIDTDGTGLFDLLAHLLADGCDRIIRGGLLAGYVEREDLLPVVRGRLLHGQQVLRRFGQLDRLVCRFDEHEQNTAENQLLGRALAACAGRVRDESLRRRVGEQSGLFHEVCQPMELDLATARSRITYDRLNEHYRHAHSLAWLILQGLGTRDLLASGGAKCFAFLIDMNALFERFVYKVVEQTLEGTRCQVRYQHHDRSLIFDAANNRPYALVVPDLLIEGPQGRSTRGLTLDAKYKLYDEQGIHTSDVYQSFLYAYGWGGQGKNGCPSSLLVYPASTRSSQGKRLRIRNGDGRTGAEILALGLSIPDTLADLARGRPGLATAELSTAISDGLGL